MGIFDSFFGKKQNDDRWGARFKGRIQEISYDDIVSVLGNPKKAKGGFIYWRGPLADIDEDLSSDEFFQLSNKDFRFSESAKPRTDRTEWFVLATSVRAIKILSDNLGGLTRNIEPV